MVPVSPPPRLKSVGKQKTVLYLYSTMPNLLKVRYLSGTGKRVPLNTIVLPPLADGSLEQGTAAEFLKLIVNKSKTADVMTVTRTTESPKPELQPQLEDEDALVSVPEPEMPLDLPKIEEKLEPAPNAEASDSQQAASRVVQLEQNLRFLQDQHAQMLAGLHHEVDCLRHRNRELQFQLIFAKGVPSTPSSPEDEHKQKMYSISPKQVNATPLQVEILERELSELKLQSQETDSRNVYLSAIVDEQKKKLERYERDREREIDRAAQQPPPSVLAGPDADLLRKLDDADALIRRLRRENSDLRREAAAYSNPVSSNYQSRDYQREGGGYHRRGGGNGGGGNSGGGTSNGNAVNEPNSVPQQRGSNGSGHQHHHNNGGGGNGRYHNHHHNHHHNNHRNFNNHHRNGNNNHWFPPLQNQQQQQQYWGNSNSKDLPLNGIVGTNATLPVLNEDGAISSVPNGRKRNNNNNHNGNGMSEGGGGGNGRKYGGKGHHHQQNNQQHHGNRNTNKPPA